MTAIEWLEETIKQMVYNGADLGEDEFALMEHIKQAKQIEREQLYGGTIAKDTAQYIDRNIIEAMKEMAKEELHSQDFISDIVFELSKIEDYAHGEVGNAITNLRKKIAENYKIK